MMMPSRVRATHVNNIAQLLPYLGLCPVLYAQSNKGWPGYSLLQGFFYKWYEHTMQLAIIIVIGHA